MRFYFIFFIFFIHMASFLLMCFFFHHVSNTGKSYFHIDQAISSSGLGFGSRFAIDICRCRKGFLFCCSFYRFVNRLLFSLILHLLAVPINSIANFNFNFPFKTTRTTERNESLLYCFVYLFIAVYCITYIDLIDIRLFRCAHEIPWN